MCGHRRLPKQGGRGSPVAARAPLSPRCVSSLLEIRMKKEKRKKRERENGAPAKRRQGPAFPQMGTRCSTAAGSWTKLGPPGDAGNPAGRPPSALLSHLLTAAMCRGFSRAGFRFANGSSENRASRLPAAATSAKHTAEEKSAAMGPKATQDALF